MSEELSPSQAAARIGASTRSVQRWISAGRLPARRVGGRWRVASDALGAFEPPASAFEPPASAFDRPTSDIGAARAKDDAPTVIMSGHAIRTLLVANRGEIARRIARTCEHLGIRAVVPTVEGPNALDLLDGQALIGAARAAGADALHPGFGFLAENAAFAEAVEAAGLRWIGPPPGAIRMMGDKGTARRLAQQLGIPILPGYDDADQSDEALAHAAAIIGVPLLVKPAAGGGGKGMRIVRGLDELPAALAAARREAAGSFGDDRLILERYLERPRHVEIQVLFDAHGAGVHLGERDCSIQRRHQKVLEETPSPAVDDETRQQMAEAALTLARAVGYVSAGTVEFLLEEDGRFQFLEMNTRLQVEHPVTELVTGRDLVADQLRIAAGEPLGFGQADLTPSGHAVEARLYAEDPDAGFLPATGRVEMLRWPAGDGIRVDAGVDVGDEVSGRFDPLLAKIVGHGRDRPEAFDRLESALDRTLVLGLTTNLRFLRWLVRQPLVRAGEARIDTLERIWPPADHAERTAIPRVAWRTAANRIASALADSTDPWSGAWRMNAPSALRLAADGEERSVRLEPDGRADDPSGPELDSIVSGDAIHVDVDGRSLAFRIAAPPDVDRAARSALAHHGGGASSVITPMPGGVIAVHAVTGQTVDAGDPIATIEAMKMEHVVTAPVAGTVVVLEVRPADQVARGQLLAVIEP